jgi:hypothetical protein
MLRKINCWEFKKCGREPGGAREATLGTCSAATQQLANGIHGGQNGGRACWVIAGTLCGGKVQGSFAEKVDACQSCDFYQFVQRQETVIKERVDILFQIGYKIG